MNGFRIVTLLVGLIPLWFGINGILWGAAEHMGSEPFTAAMDNQYRYLSGVYIGIALIIFYSAGDLRGRAQFFQLAILAIFIGGCARAVSMLMVGTPPEKLVIGMALELGGPVLLLLQARVLKR